MSRILIEQKCFDYTPEPDPTPINANYVVPDTPVTATTKMIDTLVRKQMRTNLESDKRKKEKRKK